MPQNASGASEEEGAGRRRAATPRRELERLRRSQPEPGRDARKRLQEAMLVLSGKLGYRNVAVRDVLERANVSRVRFYRQFSSKEDCFARGYAEAIEALCEALLRAAAEEAGWWDGLCAALRELGRFVAEHPALARGMLVEVHVAGGAAMAKRKEVFERLTRAVDSARRETDASRHSPPPITAAFIVSAIETAAVDSLTNGRPQAFALAIPELVRLVSSAYFGAMATSEELIRKARA